MLINSLYNIVDSICCEIRTEALTAVSLAFPIQNLILYIAVGSGVELIRILLESLEKDLETANKTAASGLTLSVIHYLILVLLGVIFIKPFFSYLQKKVIF